VCTGIQSACADDQQLLLESSVFGNRGQEEAESILLNVENFRRELHHNVDFFTSTLKSIDSDSGSLL
jgi:hypothetical protein